MIRKETVFILGAGASKPYGYPTGAELRKKIIDEFRDQYHSNTVKLEKFGSNKEDLINYAKSFISSFDLSSTKSIDLFLSRNPKFMDIGKLAIKLSIYSSERKSIFREKVDSSEDWYSYLFDRLTNEFTNSDQFKITHNKVSFITFNYDRSFEHFIYESMTNSYSEIDKGIVKCEVNKLTIIHMFGTISPLPWQEQGGFFYRKNGVYFANAEDINIIYNKTDNPMIIEAQKLIRKAKKIFFLGFGYAKENIELLDFPHILQAGQKIFGSTYGFIPKEVIDVKEKFFINGKISDKDITLKDCNSLELIRNHL